MCYYNLPICPYPRQDPIAALIFDPSKGTDWECCDQPQPWGPLSCGSLVVEHPTSLQKSTAELSLQHILATKSNIPTDKVQHKQNEESVHIKRSSNRSTPSSARTDDTHVGAAGCPWCTVVLMMVSKKSKEIQRDARQAIDEMEMKMDECDELRRMHKHIEQKEKEIEALQHEAWKKATMVIMGDKDA